MIMTTETVNWITTSTFRNMLPAVPWVISPFSTVTGLNRERKKAG